jgi:hypothetical protein
MTNNEAMIMLCNQTILKVGIGEEAKHCPISFKLNVSDTTKFVQLKGVFYDVN